MDENRENHSSHILGASSNLLGLCFIVLTSLQVLKMKEKTAIDELTLISLIIFMAASILSFLSLRNASLHGRTKRSEAFERLASGVFLAGLIFIFCTTVLVALKVVH